jgi:N-acetylglucosamine transport system permease protein
MVALGWIILASFSTSREIFTNQLIGSGLQFGNYTKALTTHNLALYFLNSLLYILPSLVFIVAISAPAAYVLSRFEFRGRRVVSGVLISGMGVPGAVLIVPLFTLFARLALLDTPQGLIIVYVCISIPFTVFLLTAFFASLPRELDEAARIDGCTAAGSFWRVMLPLARPGIVTVTIFNFIALWNDYIFALIFVNSPERRTMSIGLDSVVQSMRYSGDWGGLFAAVVVVFLPTMAVYLILSERIISGITAGAVKG